MKRLCHREGEGSGVRWLIALTQVSDHVCHCCVHVQGSPDISDQWFKSPFDRPHHVGDRRRSQVGWVRRKQFSSFVCSLLFGDSFRFLQICFLDVEQAMSRRVQCVGGQTEDRVDREIFRVLETVIRAESAHVPAFQMAHERAIRSEADGHREPECTVVVLDSQGVVGRRTMRSDDRRHSRIFSPEAVLLMESPGGSTGQSIEANAPRSVVVHGRASESRGAVQRVSSLDAHCDPLVCVLFCPSGSGTFGWHENTL